MIETRIDDAEINAGLRNLIAFGRNPSAATREIAALGEGSTRMRFRTETAPDGSKWKPSLRVQMQGGRTLTKDGHLSGSISSQSGNDYAMWGVNRIYAALMHFGGVVRAKAGKALRFRFAGGFVTVKSVTIRARPFLGVSDDDRADILDIIARRIQGAAHAG